MSGFSSRNLVIVGPTDYTTPWGYDAAHPFYVSVTSGGGGGSTTLVATANPPVYTEASIDAFSSDLAGNLRVRSVAQGIIAAGTAFGSGPVPIAIGGFSGVSGGIPNSGTFNALSVSSSGSALVTGTSVYADGQGLSSRLLVGGGISGYNGTSLDIIRTAPAAASLGSGLGTLSVEEMGRSYVNISTATTTVVKSGKGNFHGIVINTPVASGVITIYDNTSATGTKIATISFPAGLLQMGPLPAFYDVAFATGLTIVTSVAMDITVIYR